MRRLGVKRLADSQAYFQAVAGIRSLSWQKSPVLLPALYLRTHVENKNVIAAAPETPDGERSHAALVHVAEGHGWGRRANMCWMGQDGRFVPILLQNYFSRVEGGADFATKSAMS